MSNETMIELKEVSFKYPDGTNVFKTFDFTLKEGERISITGANGSGKSTLMRIAMGLLVPQSGEVKLFKTPCKSEEDFARLRARIGLVFQDSDDQLFCPTVEEDVAFGPLNLGRTHHEAHHDVHNACKALGIEHLMGSVTHRLSGGQRRLAAIATAIAMDPDVLLLDEPTAGLDETGIETLIEYLHSSTHTLLVASHNKEFLSKVVDRNFAI